MQPRKLNIKRFIVIGLILVAVVFLAIFVIKQINRSTLRLSSDEGSQLYIAGERGGEFTKLGESQATFVTSDPGVYYVKAVKDEKETIKAVTLARRQKQSVRLSLSASSAISRLGFGSLSSLLLEKNFIYGINPNTSTPGYVTLSSNQSTDFSSLAIPRIKEAVWLNHNNYLAKTLLNKVIWIKDNRVTGIHNPNGGLLSVYDFDKLDRSHFLLLTASGIYKFDGVVAQKLVSKPFSQNAEVSSDGSLIYVMDVPDFASDEGLPVSDTANSDTSLYLYGSAGNEVLSTDNLPITGSVDKVFSLGGDESYGILTSGEVVIVDGDGSVVGQAYIYFKNAQDILAYHDKIILLEKNGLWNYDRSSGEFRKFASVPAGEELIPRSLTLSEDGTAVLFSTRVSDSELKNPQTTAKNSIYQVSL